MTIDLARLAAEASSTEPFTVVRTAGREPAPNPLTEVVAAAWEERQNEGDYERGSSVILPPITEADTKLVANKLRQAATKLNVSLVMDVSQPKNGKVRIRFYPRTRITRPRKAKG